MSRTDLEAAESFDALDQAREALAALGFDAERIEAAIDLLAGVQVEAWPADRFEIELRKPVELKGESYEVLSLREPTGAEWEEIFEHPLKTRRRFAISRIAGVPMGVTGQVGIGDLIRGEAYLNSFFELGQTIRGW